MADLTVKICGLEFKNPILPAAGPPVRDGRAAVACAQGGAGGIVTKTVSTRAAQVPRPCMAEVKGGFLNTELWSELPPEQWLEREYTLAKSTGLPLIISLGYTAEEIEELARKVAPFADALELSTHYLGDDPSPMVEAVKAAKMVSQVPVFVKLSPAARDIVVAAKAARDAGADALVAINSFGPCFGIDVETGRPLMGSKEGYGWLSGPALKPLALRCVFDIARSVDLPIFGVGGVSTGLDAIEMIMAGAWAVQACTAAILKGPKVFGQIAGEMATWLDEHDYSSPDEIRGLAIRRFQERRCTTEAVPPEYDVEKCTGCRLCEISCVYDAIVVVDHKARLNAELCFGCGLCVTRCRPGALRYAG